MKKKLLILFIVSAFFAGCGAKSKTAEISPADIVRNSLSNYNSACVEKEFPKTIAKLAESDEYYSKEQFDLSKKAENEAVELFKKEDASYQEAIANIDVESNYYQDTLNRKQDIASNPNVSKSKKWKSISEKVEKHLAAAKKAMDECNPDKAKTELNAANVLLQEMEEAAGTSSAVTENDETYIVKKGDNLWNIAGAKYSNPFMWPIIFWTNESKIKDPDLIYPKQKFTIIYDSSDQEINSAIHFSKTRGSWSLFDNK